jgi:hypothetical protein
MMEVQFTTDSEDSGQHAGSSFETLRITTSDCRVLVFQFVEDADRLASHHAQGIARAIGNFGVLLKGVGDNFTRVGESIKQEFSSMAHSLPGRISAYEGRHSSSAKDPLYGGGSSNSNSMGGFNPVGGLSESYPSGLSIDMMPAERDSSISAPGASQSTSKTPPPPLVSNVSTTSTASVSTSASNFLATRNTSSTTSVFSAPPMFTGTSLTLTQGHPSQQQQQQQQQSKDGSGRLTKLELCWLRLVKEDVSVVEGLDSEEGSPAQRMHNRMKNRVR